MKLSPNGFMLIQQYEGLKLSPYYATAEEKAKGIVTIGYGNTFYENGSKVKITDKPITKTESLRLLQITTDDFAMKVGALIDKAINQNQFDALVSLAYNIGLKAFANSTVLKLVNNNPTDENIKRWFLAWNKQAGKVLPGLNTRRLKEANLYFTN
jgi:lysozyme